MGHNPFSGEKGYVLNFPHVPDFLVSPEFRTRFAYWERLTPVTPYGI
jgi:hypothetical protein